MRTTRSKHRAATLGLIMVLFAASACGSANDAEREPATVPSPGTGVPLVDVSTTSAPATDAAAKEPGGVPSIADLGAVVANFAVPPSPLAEADVQDAIAMLTASGDAATAQLAANLGQDEGAVESFGGFGESWRAVVAEDDDPNVQRKSNTETVTLPSGAQVSATYESELRLTGRVMSLDSTQKQQVGAMGPGKSAGVSGGDQATLGACPTVDGKVSGTVLRSTTVTESVDGRTTTIALRLQADVNATVDSHRKPTGFTLTNVEFTTDITTVVDGVTSTRALQGHGTVAGLGPEVADLGSPQIEFAAADAELTAGSDALFRLALLQATTAVRLLLVSVSGVSDAGLCVRLQAETHGVTSLPPGGTTTIDVTVIDTATEQPIELPVDGTAFGELTPTILEHTPGSMSFTAPSTDEPPYSVYLQTDTVLGAHTIEVVFAKAQGWKVDTNIDVFKVTGVKCDGAAGTWTLSLSANFEGAIFSGQVTAVIDGATLSGPYELTGQTVGGGITITQSGNGTLSFVQDGGDDAHLVMAGTAWSTVGGAVSASGDVQGGGEITLTSATPADCPAS